MSAQAGLTAVAVAAAFTSVENVKFYKIAHRGGTNLAMNEAYRRFGHGACTLQILNLTTAHDGIKLCP